MSDDVAKFTYAEAALNTIKILWSKPWKRSGIGESKGFAGIANSTNMRTQVLARMQTQQGNGGLL